MTRSTIVALLAFFFACFAVACSDSNDASGTTMPTAASVEHSAFEMSARILGPVQNDDNADMRIELKEINGVAARVNFLRMTCSNGTQREWGAGNIAADHGSNQIDGNAELVVIRHYVCPSSGRPRRVEADLVDANGLKHQVIAAPYHPDWPGV